MKVVKIFSLLAFIVFGFQWSGVAQNRQDARTMFKKHVNNMVERVEQADQPAQKRRILKNSFDDLLNAINKVEDMRNLSEKDQRAVNKLKGSIQDKMNELKGTNGYKRVPDNQLNNFANYVQQDLEQADEITISVTVLLLIIIILLLI